MGLSEPVWSYFLSASQIGKGERDLMARKLQGAWRALRRALTGVLRGMRKKVERPVAIDPFRVRTLTREEGIATLARSLELSRRELEKLEPWADRAFYLRFVIARTEAALSEVSK